MPENWNFYNPVNVKFGADSFFQLLEVVNSFDANKIALVTGKSSMKKLGVTKKAEEMLSNKEVFLFDKVKANPTLETVDIGNKLSKMK